MMLSTPLLHILFKMFIKEALNLDFNACLLFLVLLRDGLIYLGPVLLLFLLALIILYMCPHVILIRLMTRGYCVCTQLLEAQKGPWAHQKC